MAKGPQDVKHRVGLNSIAKPMPTTKGTNSKGWHDFLNAQRNGLKKLDIASHDEPCCNV
jgi:hypothetical protein